MQTKIKSFPQSKDVVLNKKTKSRKVLGSYSTIFDSDPIIFNLECNMRLAWGFHSSLQTGFLEPVELRGQKSYENREIDSILSCNKRLKERKIGRGRGRGEIARINWFHRREKENRLEQKWGFPPPGVNRSRETRMKAKDLITPEACRRIAEDSLGERKVAEIKTIDDGRANFTPLYVRSVLEGSSTFETFSVGVQWDSTLEFGVFFGPEPRRALVVVLGQPDEEMADPANSPLGRMLLDEISPVVMVAKERLKQVITNAGEKDISDLCTEPPQIETVLTSLVVVSSKDEEPINKFIDLFNTDQLPSLLNDGAMDPQIMKYYLLLHDNQDGTPEKATKILSEMRNTFGSNDCGLMCINSSQDGLEEHQENPWALHKAESSPGQHLGCFLNNDDRDEVAVTRKGFRNQIKNLWWRKGKEDTPDSLNGPMYTFSSIESQIRVLGDYAFMLRDYDLALSNYRLLSTDYKLDKSWNRYAGVQEMMGLTYFLFDQSRKDAEYCMENAFNTYLKMGLSGQRNATRCGLWWVEMLKTRDQFKEAAAVYLRISGTSACGCDVEQASYCYLFAKPPMLRKYGFHLVLSGDLYKKCDQMKHAIRTYRRALTVFKGTKWSHIRDHVHFHIGKWYAFLGMSDVAVKHIMEVLACGHQSKTTQELFLRDFFQIVQKTGKTFEVLRLQLPVIDMPSLKVVYEDHRTYASSEASLEEDMVPASSAIRNNWLESQPKLALKKYKESNVSVAGEAIKVEIGFKNPLQIPISVSSVSLICEHSVRSDETEAAKKVIYFYAADANCLTTENQSDDQVRNVDTSGECSSEKSPFTVSEVDISLGGGQTLLLTFLLTLPIVLGQNMKMKISHPRYLIIGNQEVMDMEFPACLERKTKSAWSDEHAKTNYTHDERDALVYGETPFTWPLWLRAATHGNISLYLTLYYEMGDTSTVMKYRILRMHYNLEDKFKDFQIQQLSSFGNNWEISLLQPLDAIFPSELLLAGQALSCFFNSRLLLLAQNARKSAITKDKDSAVGAVGLQRDLISVYSIASTSPIWWLVEGPRTIQHNFSASFCEIKLKMTIHNSSNEVASIRIETSDSTSSSNTTASVPSGNEEGWHDISLLNDVKVSSIGKPPSQECVSPFIWSGASSPISNLSRCPQLKFLYSFVSFLLGHMICQIMSYIGLFHPPMIKGLEQGSLRGHAKGILIVLPCCNRLEH
ncbi:hypothetical protein C3L33_21763, partial [Rhododendron williamsianum]